ncbi:MAG: GTPase HflX [Bradymonadales bacterium]|nr:GTPase HflX [Bradymonadales bacterium]
MKASHLHALEKLLRRDKSISFISPQLATRLTQLTREIHRIVGVLLDRRGEVNHVIVGDARRLYLPDIGRQRAGTTRLRGLRLVRSQLESSELSREDLTDLTRLRLDLVAVVEASSQGVPREVQWAHLIRNTLGNGYDHLRHQIHSLNELDLQFLPFIEALEEELHRHSQVSHTTGGVPGLLVFVKTKTDRDSEMRLAELHELAKTAGLNLLETVVQQRFKADPRTLVGQDKLEEIELTCLDLGAEVLLFGQDLNPSQARAISARTDLKVIDRTQLILDIFAQHARSKGGKMQVELAQLKYALPRLVAKNTAMSRLMGGIGGRGPGETKLEINRRRAYDRINRLQEEIEELSRIRSRLRQRRKQRDVPVVAIIGYTNAGKSTLLNTLTNARVVTKDQLFSTLDPTSRRLRFPRNRELVLTDTVGFIHDLPKELQSAFKATLEELEDAHLLIQLVDASTDRTEAQIQAVLSILSDLGLQQKPRLLVFNKIDRVDGTIAENLARSYDAIPICALDQRTLTPLIDQMQRRLWTEGRRKKELKNQLERQESSTNGMAPAT